jgi:hypothetical protein
MAALLRPAPTTAAAIPLKARSSVTENTACGVAPKYLPDPA